MWIGASRIMLALDKASLPRVLVESRNINRAFAMLDEPGPAAGAFGQTPDSLSDIL
jgi:hypothetical protein